MELLLEAVKYLAEQGGSQSCTCGDQCKELQQVVDRQGDELDEVKQRAMKGNLILVSKGSASNPSVLKTDKELSASSESLLTNVRREILKKWGVDVPVSDFQACHRMKEDHTVIVRIWNRTPGAAFWRLVEDIRAGGPLDDQGRPKPAQRKINLFANFQLTPRRNQLSYHLRNLKKENKIFNYYTNENGMLSFRLKERGPKIKVTYVSAKPGDIPKTLSVQDIDNIISKHSK